MPLLELLLKQRAAFTYLRKGKQWDKFKLNNEFEGLIRSLEITFGLLNGWHPHTHELWFVSDKVDELEFLNYVKRKMEKVLY